MQAKFLLKREKNNTLSYARIDSPDFEVHFHSHIELYIILSGSIEIIINNTRRVLNGGEISIALSYDAHGYRTVEKADAICLIIPRTYCSEILSFFENKLLPSPFISDGQTFKTVSEAAIQLLQETNEVSRRGYVYVILGEVLKHMSEEAQSTTQEVPFSADMLIYISNHFREEISLNTISTHFGYNPSYLSRIFRQTFGMSFCKYLTMIRLREFILLMSSNEMNITECALECGFGSMRSFYRSFHDEFGCTPKEYLSRK
jgi:AraC-like DNA-binding protein